MTSGFIVVTNDYNFISILSKAAHLSSIYIYQYLCLPLLSIMHYVAVIRNDYNGGDTHLTGVSRWSDYWIYPSELPKSLSKEIQNIKYPFWWIDFVLQKGCSVGDYWICIMYVAVIRNNIMVGLHSYPHGYRGVDQKRLRRCFIQIIIMSNRKVSISKSTCESLDKEV